MTYDNLHDINERRDKERRKTIMDLIDEDKKDKTWPHPDIEEDEE